MGRRRIQRCKTPELKDLLYDSGGRWFRPVNSCDEVFPGVLLGDADTALSTQCVKDLAITHILNAAQGHNNSVYGGYVSTSPTYYAKLGGIKYLGIPAMDMPGFYIKPYLRDAAEFINDALKEGGRVLVHCQCGISRSAALVAGFLMLKRGMSVHSALANIKKKRNIFPNQGFLSQLCDLDYELRRSGDLPDVPPDDRTGTSSSPSPPSSFRNPNAYPRFTLVPSKVLDTYTSTKNYVVPRRAASVDRYDPPRVGFRHNPLVDSSLRRTRGRRSLPYYYDDDGGDDGGDDDDLLPGNPKVFDTYGRYGASRSATSPLPPSKALEYEPVSRYPKSSFYYNKYYPLPAHEYLPSLDRYYSTSKYYRDVTPLLSPTTVYRTYKVYPEKSYLVGSSYVPNYAPRYNYPHMNRYPLTTRTLLWT